MKKALFILIVILLGCNAEKKMLRKESKAWDIYSTSPRLVQKSVPLVSALYPCINEIVRSDTNTVYVIDSFEIEKKVPFEVYKDKVLDTVIDNISIFSDSTGLTVKYLGKKEKTIITIRDSVIDRKEVNRLNDSLNNSNVKEAQLKGQITQLEKDNAELKADKKKSDIKFYALIGLIAIVISVIVFVKVKTKLPI